MGPLHVQCVADSLDVVPIQIRGAEQCARDVVVEASVDLAIAGDVRLKGLIVGRSDPIDNRRLQSASIIGAGCVRPFLDLGFE